MLDEVTAALIDLDGVLYVEEEPVPGAAAAIERLREAGVSLRFVTNTTAHSRDQTLAKLRRLDFAVPEHELMTPASLALAYCRDHGYRRVALVMKRRGQARLRRGSGVRRGGPGRHRR